jgi:hemerythrin superfamily protein
MNAVDLIKRDHEKFRKMFKEYERAKKTDDRREMGRIADRLFASVTAHEEMEEVVFYPALRNRVRRDAKETIAEGIQEHHVAGLLVEEMRRLDTGDGEFDPKFTVFKENVEHHLEEEEDELLPEAPKHFSDEELADMGSQMEEIRTQILNAELARSR